MTKYVGYPEPSEVNGHMIKLIGAPGQKESRYECQDCHAKADYYSFDSGLRGCPARPESLNYLTIRAFKGIENMTTQDRAVASREHWKNFADRIGMKLQYWTVVDSDPEVCARFVFWPHDGGHEEHEAGGNYELRFGQDGHGIHAVRA